MSDIVINGYFQFIKDGAQMEIQSNKMTYSTPTQTRNNTNTNKKHNEETTKSEPKESYIPTQDTEKVTYDKPKVDHSTIERLKAESDRAYGALKSMVEELLRSQGKTFQDFLAGADIEVDEATRLDAQASIAEGGENSPEKVSDRIVEFAIAVSGGDKSKLDVLKSAIDEGFKQAAAILGGNLPEISHKTYDLVMEKLTKWQEAPQ
jgi:hypothetical protein